MLPRMSHDAAYWINHLRLTRHIEGGYFSEIYKSELRIEASALPAAFTASRHSVTHIYFLLEKDQISALHRIQSDELWHFYAGEPLIVYEIEKDGNLVEHVLGQNPEKGEKLFSYIKAGSWFGAKLQANDGYALVGCTVSPGFDYADFELAAKEKITAEFPQHKAIIDLLIR